MRDYVFITTDDKRIPTAELPTLLIVALLASGVEIVGREDPDEETAVMKRLELELFIRQKGLRT